ncbi:MAG: hypothetical protein A2Z14_14175 [Chloroflexi bacterium RBG_16_48_8]|nr:MAG: hypothetical protein A2Z14_14175 [Chloroflexi bacterium RBG_16_48_8]
MGHYMVTTKLSPEKAIEKAVAYFGEKGLGLEITGRGDNCVSFTGGGGHIDIITCSGKKTEVELETREWDHQVRDFMNKIG